MGVPLYMPRNRLSRVQALCRHTWLNLLQLMRLLEITMTFVCRTWSAVACFEIIACWMGGWIFLLVRSQHWCWLLFHMSADSFDGYFNLAKALPVLWSQVNELLLNIASCQFQVSTSVTACATRVFWWCEYCITKTSKCRRLASVQQDK